MLLQSWNTESAKQDLYQRPDWPALIKLENLFYLVVWWGLITIDYSCWEWFLCASKLWFVWSFLWFLTFGSPFAAEANILTFKSLVPLGLHSDTCDGEWQVHCVILTQWLVQWIYCHCTVLTGHLLLFDWPNNGRVTGHFSAWLAQTRAGGHYQLSLNPLPTENIFERYTSVSAWCDQLRLKMSYPRRWQMWDLQQHTMINGSGVYSCAALE